MTAISDAQKQLLTTMHANLQDLALRFVTEQSETGLPLTTGEKAAVAAFAKWIRPGLLMAPRQ